MRFTVYVVLTILYFDFCYAEFAFCWSLGDMNQEIKHLKRKTRSPKKNSFEEPCFMPNVFKDLHF